MPLDPTRTAANSLCKRTLAVVMAGGNGTRLGELTRWDCKPALPFGGQYRNIDFPLSNCVNSDIRRIAVLTQYKAHSLIQHVRRGWGYLHGELGEFIDIVPAQQQHGEWWYRGTADAVTQNIDIVDSYDVDYVLILAGDHIYKMDYELMLRQHVDTGADVTVGCLTVPREEASAFGVMAIDENQQITSFLEKPKDPPGMPGDPTRTLASMGIYVFRWDFLRELLRKDAEDPNSKHDFGGDIVPDIVKNGKAMAHKFDDSCVRHRDDAPAYWRDVGTVDAFHQANIDLTDFDPELDLWDRNWPIWTYSESTPPAKFIHDEQKRRGAAVSSMVSGGCIISGTEVRESLLFTGVHTNSFAVLDRVVALPYAVINRHARLSNVVLDRGVVIPNGLVIGEDHEEDAKWFRVTDKGVTLITQDMLDMRAASL